MSTLPFVLVGNSNSVPEILYATGFSAPDPVAVVRFSKNDILLLVNSMEFGRARNQAKGCTVASADTLGLPKEERGGVDKLLACVLAQRGVTAVDAPPDFPLYAVEALHQKGVTVSLCFSSPFAASRMVKSAEEIEKIRSVQKIAHEAEDFVRQMIEDASVDSQNRLVYEGALLTSEHAQQFVRSFLTARGTLDLEGTILAGGTQASDPHEQGQGPLYAQQWIVCDIFPRDLASGYWGDITRTFMKGEPSPEQAALYSAVAQAQQLALRTIRDGVSGADVHRAVTESFKSAGFETGVAPDGRPFGFIHSTGHGVGLEIHEEPRLSVTGGMLKENMVVTVEPGLYYHDNRGGVRIEDTVRVTADGCEIL